MEKLRSTNQLKKSLALLSDPDDLGVDPDHGGGTLPGELRGDIGEDNGLPGDLKEAP